MLREPVRCVVDVESGGLKGRSGRYEKRLSDLDGLYLDAAAHAALVVDLGDPVVYDVEDFRPSSAAGDLICGVTRMSPGRVGAEFFMTRGHIHARADRPEIYYGQRGEGVMLMESPDGETRAVEIGPQVICYVPPYWIHRSVNTGTTDLVMVFAYPADSGQDYGIIEASNGMRHRVMARDGGGWELRDNAAYLVRPADVVTNLMNPSS